MRVSILKQKTDNIKLRRELCFFFDYDSSALLPDAEQYVFRSIINSCNPDETLEVVFDKLCEELRKHLELFEDKDLIHNFRKASQFITGNDDAAFAIGTSYGDRLLAQRKKREERIQKIDDLNFLYEALGIKPEIEKELKIVHNIAVTPLYDVFIENREAIIEDKFVAYKIVEEMAIPLLGTPEYRWWHQTLMYSLSNLLYGDYKYWIKTNNVDKSLLINYRKKEKTNEHS